MKVGELYSVCNKWQLPRSTSEFWLNCGHVIYLGEDIIHREDGEAIVNHAVLAGGEQRILDRSFLKFLEPINESR